MAGSKRTANAATPQQPGQPGPCSERATAAADCVSCAAATAAAATAAAGTVGRATAVRVLCTCARQRGAAAFAGGLLRQLQRMGGRLCRVVPRVCRVARPGRARRSPVTAL
eukprot:365868-Chlamydomonas_euryale.AAC.2